MNLVINVVLYLKFIENNIFMKTIHVILFKNKKNGVCLRPHGRSENILKKCSYELYTIIKFFKSPSNHNLS